MPVYPNQGIVDGLNVKVDPNEPADPKARYLEDWGDDKGNADYFMLAFGLFGFNVQALYHLYFLILGISMAVFIAAFFRNVAYLTLVPLFLAGHHLAVITLLDNLVTSTVHDAHFLAAMACLASLHVALLLTRPERNTLWSVPALVVQLAVIVLVIGSRPSAIWLVYFPIGVFALSLVPRVVKRSAWGQLPRILLTRGWIVLLLLVAPRLLSTYHTLVFDRTYTESGIESHMVWHALYMGLSVHPDAATYDLVYTDATSYNAAYWYLMDHPELARELDIDTSRLKFDPKYTQTWITDVVGFRRYEEIGKRNFLSFVSEHPRYLLESMLLYKPKYLVEQILWQAGLLTAWPSWVKIELAHAPPSRHLLDLFALAPLSVVILSVAVACASGAARRAWLWPALSGLLVLASLLPSIVVAPIYYELPVVFGLVATFVYALLAFATIVAVRWRRRAAPRASRPRRPGRSSPSRRSRRW